MGEAKAAEVLDRIKASTDMEDLRGCDIIIEAVFEKIVKDKVIAETEEFLAENGVWGSNTDPANHTAGVKGAVPEELCRSALLLAGRQDAVAGDHRGRGNLGRDTGAGVRLCPAIRRRRLSSGTRRVSTPRARSARRSSKVCNWLPRDMILHVDNLSRLIGMPTGMLSLLDEVQIKLVTDIYRTQIEMGC